MNNTILWLAHEGNLSGANYCLLEFINILSKRGYNHHVVVPYMGTFAKEIEKHTIPISLIHFHGWAAPKHSPTKNSTLRSRLRNVYAVYQIKRLIKKISPAFVATNTIISPVAAYAAKQSSKKHIWFVHEFGEEDHGFTIAGSFGRGAKIMNELSAKIVFNSRAVERKYQGIVPNNKRFIAHNPVLIKPARKFLALEGALHLLMLGQVSFAKNHIEAIKALSICKQRGLLFVLSIVGRAEEEWYLKTLEESVEAYDLRQEVYFQGSTKEPAEAMVNNHAFLMCSHNEAFGRVTIEALKCGLPVIAANSGGSVEIIKDAENGYLYEKGKPEDLADKIMLLYSNFKNFDRVDIAEQAERNFNENNTGNQLCQIFH